MRRPAANEPGHINGLTSSCIRGYSFLRAERTCQWLAGAINSAGANFNISLWGPATATLGVALTFNENARLVAMMRLTAIAPLYKPMSSAPF
jgi:hypothetical protein